MSGLVTNHFIPVKSPITQKTYNIMVKQFGDGKNFKILISNGGPGSGFEYMVPPFLQLIPYGFTLYFYYQLGNSPSDNPSVYHPQGDTTGLVNSDYSIEYYAAELEQVRSYLNIQGPKNYILGHSFGGMIMFQWAKDFPQSVNLMTSGLIFSSGVSSIPRYIEYTNQVLSRLPVNIQKILSDPKDPQFKDISNKYYNDIYILQIRPRPPAVKETKQNHELYVYLQGPSEFIVSGTLQNFDIRYVLPSIKVRTLTIGGKLDSVDPELLKEDAMMMPNGELHLTNGSHNCYWDDSVNYFNALLKFLKQPVLNPQINYSLSSFNYNLQDESKYLNEESNNSLDLTLSPALYQGQTFFSKINTFLNNNLF